jgi:hypothetical protein
MALLSPSFFSSVAKKKKATAIAFFAEEEEEEEEGEVAALQPSVTMPLQTKQTQKKR